MIPGCCARLAGPARCPRSGAEALSHAYDSRATVSDALQHVLTRRPLPAGLREQVIADSLAADSDARLAWPRHGITEDITAAASAIEVPAQVLSGEHDRVEPARPVRRQPRSRP